MSRFFGTSDKCIAGCALAFVLIVLPAGASAASETVLHAFRKTDGADPVAGLITDGAGNFYGTTISGGARRSCSGYGCGTVFELAPDGTETVLHAFTGGNDGAYPYAGLVDRKGNLYGTAGEGGKNGRGTVFKLAPDGTLTVRYSFCSKANCTDGAYPVAKVIARSGNLYGTTEEGGGTGCNGYGCGTIFKIAADGTETVLYSFQGANDGAYPFAGVIADSAGNLYGTTYRGGGTGCNNSGCGTVFKLAPNGTETVLYAFQDGTDGAYPYAGLIADSAGNLYGTTEEGGAHYWGTVFKINPKKTETTLYSFCAQANCSDGSEPKAGLIMDSSGNLYGTTFAGGANKCEASDHKGCGAVFELAPDGTETVLYSFMGGASDGMGPSDRLIVDSAGNLYGTTELGAYGKRGWGTVFEISK